MESVYLACFMTALAMVGCYTELLRDMSLKVRLACAIVCFIIAAGSLLVDAGYPLFYALAGAFFTGGILDKTGLIKVERRR